MNEQKSWDAVVAGIDAIVWSTLARWDEQTKQLIHADDKNVFDLHWKKIDSRSGRWLCWLAFGVGAESLLRGAFGLKGHTMGNLGACHPWKKWFGMNFNDIGIVSTAVCELTKVRNRDAHFYVRDARALDFPMIENNFVPALNLVIDYTNRDEVAARCLSKSPISHT